MKYACIIFVIFISSCNQKNTSGKESPAGKNASADGAIPELRDSVSKKPVAAYLIPMGDLRLDRKFGLEIYETPYTFKYLLEMHYDGMVQNDTLKIPNTGRWPVVKIVAGTEKLSCIIGFLDNENKFREYKLLSAKNDNLALTVLKSYGVTAY